MSPLPAHEIRVLPSSFPVHAHIAHPIHPKRGPPDFCRSSRGPDPRAPNVVVSGSASPKQCCALHFRDTQKHRRPRERAPELALSFVPRLRKTRNPSPGSTRKTRFWIDEARSERVFGCDLCGQLPLWFSTAKNTRCCGLRRDGTPRYCGWAPSEAPSELHSRPPPPNRPHGSPTAAHEHCSTLPPTLKTPERHHHERDASLHGRHGLALRWP